MAGGGFLSLIPPEIFAAQGTFPWDWGPLQTVREGSWGSDPAFQAPISLCVADHGPTASPRRASATPQASSSHQPMPFPSWPAIQARELVDLRSPCDPGQMVPVNISCHGAIMAPASHVCLRRTAPSTCLHLLSRAPLPHTSAISATPTCIPRHPGERSLYILAQKMKAHRIFPAPSRLAGA